MNDYSFMQRLLHRLALGPRAVREMAFDLEVKAADPDTAISKGKHVFVSSLARAGTTILVRDLHSLGVFSSLTYSDMPFVLAPNLWAKFSGNDRARLKRAERAHGDGIEVDAQSPEAFEEVFWRTFDDASDGNSVDPETAMRFEQHIQAVTRRYQRARYLSKNNASICRLRFLCSHFPNSMVLVPFRKPEDHARSMLRQHQRFVKMQSDDRFVLQYMNWLGHHEFGLGYHPPLGRALPDLKQLDELDYWLDEWHYVYTRLLDDKAHCGEQMQLVSHERLCAGASPYWASLMEKLGLPTDAANSYRSKPASGDAQLSSDLARRCVALFAELESQAG